MTIDPGELTPEMLLGSLDRAGIAPRAPELARPLSTARLWPLVHIATRTPIDLVLAGRGIEQDFLDRAVPVDLGGFVVPVLSAEDLVATKVISARRKDREDVLGVLETMGARLDRPRLLQTLADLDSALEEPRARKSFDRLERALRRRRR